MRKLLLIIALSCSTILVGQNLIPNPSFELGPPVSTWSWEYYDSTICDYTDTLGGPLFWTVTRLSPDRVIEGGVFLCGHDQDTAAYDSCYVIFGGENNLQFAEAGKTTLLTALIPDSAYNLSFYAQRETWSQPSFYLPSRMHFVFNNGDTVISPLITDTLLWNRFNMAFIASASATEMELFAIGDTFCGLKVDSINLHRVTITSVKEISDEIKVTIHPNPTTKNITITSDIMLDNPVVIIRNSLGQEVLLKKFTTTDVIQVELDVPAGLYFLTIRSADKVITKKILKE